jgi:hypothetical protein
LDRESGSQDSCNRLGKKDKVRDQVKRYSIAHVGKVVKELKA